MKNGKGGAGLAREERLQIMLSAEELKGGRQFQIRPPYAEPGGGNSRTAPVRARSGGSGS